MHPSTLRARLASLSLVAVTAVGATLVAVPAASATEAPPPGQASIPGTSEVPAAEGGVEEREDGASSRYTSFPEGGTWNHGTLQYVYSKYFPNTRKHGSSVKNGNGISSRSPNVGAGSRAVATITKTMAGNSAYSRIY